MKSLKFKLITYFSSILFLSCIILAIFSTINASSALKNCVKDNLQTISQQSEKIIVERIEGEKTKLEQIAAKAQICNLYNPTINKINFLDKELEPNGYIKMNIIDKKGMSFSTNRKKLDLSDRDYFKKALQGDTVISDLITSKTDGSLIIVYATPIKYNNEIIGVLTAVQNGKQFSEIISDIQLGKSGYAIIINDKGKFVAHKDVNNIINSKNLIEESKINKDFKHFEKIINNMINKKSGSGEYSYKGTEKLIGFSPIENTNWSIGITVPTSQALSELNTMEIINLIATIVLVMIFIVIIYIIGNKLSASIMLATCHANKMADGDFTQNASNKLLIRKDELGQLGKALNKMINNFKNLFSDIFQSSQHLATSSEELTTTSEQVSIASSEIAKTIEHIAKGSSDQAAATKIGVEKSQELGDLIEKDQEYMINLNKVSNNISKLIDDGLIVIDDLIEKATDSGTASKEIFTVINKTNESSNNIREASNVIASIAEQTNLLALNAAIEAARAGEHGTGFAVVAEEIRKLAEQSTLSTKKIDEIVNELIENSSNAVTSIENVSKIIEKQIESVKETELKYNAIAKAIESSIATIETLNISSKEMEQKKSEILNIIENLSVIAQENAAGTQEASASAEEQSASIEEIANSSENLEKLAQELQKSISKFKI